MTTSSPSPLYTGTTLKFFFNESTQTLDLLLNDGTTVGMWGQTLEFAYDPQQTSVGLVFSPADSSYSVEAELVDSAGRVVVGQSVGADTVITITGQPSIGTTFNINLGNSVAAQARATRDDGPGARLETRLVFSVVEPTANSEIVAIVVS